MNQVQTSFQEVPISAVRAYWNARPCNIRHSPKPVGTQEYFDEVEARKYMVEPHIPAFAQFERWKGKRVLEIGCGIGTDTINFARHGAEVTAVDLSSSSLEVARQRAAVFGLDKQIRFVEANAEELPTAVEPAAYDLVYSFGVIHHTPHPERVIQAIAENYVRPGTTLKLMVYNRRSWKVLAILLREGKGAFWKLDELVARSSEAQTGCPVTFSYTPKTVRGLVGDRFAIDDVFIDHIFPYKVKDYVRYQYNMEWYFRMLPALVFRRLERSLGWHLCVNARALGSGGGNA